MVIEDAALLNRRVTHMTPAALFSRRLQHRKNYWPWLVTMDAERFYRLLRRDLTGEWAKQMAAGSTPATACAEFSWLCCTGITWRRLNIHELMRVTRRAADKRVPVVAHRDRDGRWLVTITAESFFNFLRGVLPPAK